MSNNGQREKNSHFILTKSYEIAYALFRLASQMGEKDFAERLRISGSDLLSATAGEDYARSGQSLRVMECLVKFAGDMAIIGSANSDVLLREIYALDATIAEHKNVAKTDEIDISEIFSKREPAKHNPATSHPAKMFAALNPANDEPAKVYPAIIEPANANPAIAESTVNIDPAIEGEDWEERIDPMLDPAIDIDEEDAPNNINGILKSAIRQNTILERIRQSGNCRLKDIQELLPDCSERTIRYDIQTLLEQNLVERVGSAGPSVYYRARTAV